MFRFLLDENISPQVRLAALRKYPHLDINCIGDTGYPPTGSPDELILEFIADTNRILVTKNRKSMPGHVEAVKARGIMNWTVFRVRANTTYDQLIEALFLFNEASTPEEGMGKMIWIPI